MRVYCKVCGQRGRITKTNQLVLSLMGSLTPEGRQMLLNGLEGNCNQTHPLYTLDNHVGKDRKSGTVSRVSIGCPRDSQM